MPRSAKDPVRRISFPLSGTFEDTESASVQLSISDVDTTISDYANFDAAVTAAVAAYVGPGSYAWDGTNLTWDGDR